MADRKTATLMLRLSPAIKQDLRARATRERRSLFNMVEVMILDYSRWHAGAVDYRNDEVPCACGPHARATVGGVR